MTAVLDDIDTDQVDEQSQIEALQQQVADLQLQLRRARRGYVSKAQVQKVVEVGRQRRVWCAEAQRIAEKYGVVGPDKIKVKVNLGILGTATIDVDAEEFDRKDDDEARKVWLADQIKISVSVGGQISEGALTPTVVSFEEVIPTYTAPTTNGHGFPFALLDGFQFGYVSNMGRTAHVVGSQYYDRRGPAICGVRPTTPAGWVATSPQAERMTDYSVVADDEGFRPSTYAVCTDCNERSQTRGLRD